MDSDTTHDKVRTELDLERIRSEIALHNAQCAALRRSKWSMVLPYMVAMGVVAAIVAAFAGFFADMYQIAVTHRDRLTREKAGLEAKVVTLRSQVALLPARDAQIKKYEARLNAAAALAVRKDKDLDVFHHAASGVEEPSTGLGGGAQVHPDTFIPTRRLRLNRWPAVASLGKFPNNLGRI